MQTHILRLEEQTKLCGDKMKHVVSCSFGKDSLAMLLMMLEKQMPIDEVVYFNIGEEFEPIDRNKEKMKQILEAKGIKFTELKPKTSYMFNMLEREVTKRDGTKKHGYGWCGGVCRWGTSLKQNAIREHNKQNNEEVIDYIGIAYDEPKRVREDKSKKYPLVDWKMTEKDCLDYCYSKGWNWEMNNIDLYKILDRVSCWCCRNKNLKELKNIYKYLPNIWENLKDLQSKIEIPFKQNKTIFDLEERFKEETQCKK